MPELFELDRLAAVLQQDLDTQTAIEARRMATADVTAVVGQPLTAGTHDVTLPADYLGRVSLPRFPAGAITSVALVDRDTGAETVVGSTGYVLEGQALRITQWPLVPPFRVHVVYAFGSDDDEWLEVARAIALRAAARLYQNPEQLRSESVLGYSRTAMYDEATMCLTRGEVRQLRAQYGGASAYSVPIGSA